MSGGPRRSARLNRDERLVGIVDSTMPQDARKKAEQKLNDTLQLTNQSADEFDDPDLLNMSQSRDYATTPLENFEHVEKDDFLPRIKFEEDHVEVLQCVYIPHAHRLPQSETRHSREKERHDQFDMFKREHDRLIRGTIVDADEEPPEGGWFSELTTKLKHAGIAKQSVFRYMQDFMFETQAVYFGWRNWPRVFMHSSGQTRMSYTLAGTANVDDLVGNAYSDYKYSNVDEQDQLIHETDATTLDAYFEGEPLQVDPGKGYLKRSVLGPFKNFDEFNTDTRASKVPFVSLLELNKSDREKNGYGKFTHIPLRYLEPGHLCEMRLDIYNDDKDVYRRPYLISYSDTADNFYIIGCTSSFNLGVRQYFLLRQKLFWESNEWRFHIGLLASNTQLWLTESTGRAIFGKENWDDLYDSVSHFESRYPSANQHKKRKVGNRDAYNYWKERKLAGQYPLNALVTEGLIEEMSFDVRYANRRADVVREAEPILSRRAFFAVPRYRRTALYYETWNVINHALRTYATCRGVESEDERYALDENILIAARYRKAFSTVRNTYTDKRGYDALLSEYYKMIDVIKKIINKWDGIGDE